MTSAFSIEETPGFASQNVNDRSFVFRICPWPSELPNRLYSVLLAKGKVEVGQAGVCNTAAHTTRYSFFISSMPLFLRSVNEVCSGDVQSQFK